MFATLWHYSTLCDRGQALSGSGSDISCPLRMLSLPWHRSLLLSSEDHSGAGDGQLDNGRCHPCHIFNSPVHSAWLTDTFENHGAILLMASFLHIYHLSYLCFFCKFFIPIPHHHHHHVLSSAVFSLPGKRGEVEHGCICATTVQAIF